MSVEVTMNSEVEKFWSKIDKSGDCWVWTGHCRKDGYATMNLDGRTMLAHRISFLLTNGYLPERGLVLDHLCRNHGCVNPAHLEVVTIGENVLRGINPAADNRRKTHCPMGHEYTEDNVTMYSERRRRCKICLLEKRKRSYRRNIVSILEKKKAKYYARKADKDGAQG